MEFLEFEQIADALFITDMNKEFIWTYVLIGAICYAVVYAFQAIALYTIAKRAGIGNRWMAFVPFLNTYYIGVVSDKNKIFKLDAKIVGIAAAVFEFAYFVLAVVQLAAEIAIFNGGFASPTYELGSYGGVQMETFVGYEISPLPERLAWAGTAYNHLGIPVWILAVLQFVSHLCLLIAFFQTYSCRCYVAFAILSAIFPIKGIFMFAVRNNTGKNYGQYLREKQQRQYQAYQDYMRQSGGYNAGNYNGGNAYNQNPYQNPPTPQDPFSDVGANQNGSNSDGSGSNSGKDDPFSDF